MKYRIEFVDELMIVVDDQDGLSHDAFEVDANEPWDAVEALAEFGREYSLDACQALKKLRAYLRDCQ